MNRVRGTIEKIYPVKGNGEYESVKFVVVVPTDDKPQYWPIKAYHKHMNTILSLNEGDKVTVFFEMTGNRWDKDDGEIIYFVSLVATEIEVLNKMRREPIKEEPAYELPARTNTPIVEDEEDDLPF